MEVGAAPHGVSTRAAETRLTIRAHELLSAGPANAVTLIEHVCQLPGAPTVVAEQMAAALFAEHPEFVRAEDGRWQLTAPQAVRETLVQPMDPMPAWTQLELGAAVPGFTPIPDELARLRFVVVDVETTGSRAWSDDRVTEVAAVVVQGGAVVDRFETLVNPQRPIPPMIPALTRISWDMVRDKPKFRDVCDDVLRVLQGNVFVAHNADFDWRFLAAEVFRASGRRLEGHRLCTVRLARRLLPQLRSRRLDSLAYYYDVHIHNRHRAGGDADATATILIRLLDEARSRDCRSWASLASIVGVRPRVRRSRRHSAMPQPVSIDTTA